MFRSSVRRSDSVAQRTTGLANVGMLRWNPGVERTGVFSFGPVAYKSMPRFISSLAEEFAPFIF